MKCPRCQQENPPQTRFCLSCGRPPAATGPSVTSSSVADVQPVLGAIARTAARLCRSRGQCATSLDEAKGSRFAAPEASTPKHLAERIINPKASLVGERKQVTVLFADLKDPMELLADRDPGEACTGEMGMTYWPEKAETEMRNLG